MFVSNLSFSECAAKIQFGMNEHLRGPFAQKKKNLYYSFDCDENLYTYAKSKMEWGNRHELFFQFSS